MAETLLLTAPQAGELLGISRAQVFALRNQGRLPAPIHVGLRSVRWRRKDIERWIDLGCPARAEFEEMIKGVQDNNGS